MPVLAGLLVLATLAYGGSELHDAEARGALMVAPGATKVEFKKLGLLQQVYYEVKTPYPAEEVLSWLREQLAQRGWQPLEDDFLNPGLPSAHVTGWQSFGDASSRQLSWVQQWMADWQDANGNVVVYALRYRTTDRTHLDSDTLHVFGSYSSKAVADKQREAAAAWRARGN